MLNGGDRLVHYFFSSSFGQPEMPPDAGHDGRESAPATIPGCYIFPVLKPSCPAFARRGNGRQDHLETSAAGRTPATASHACMTMTVAGLPSRRQESDAFPLTRCAALFTFPLFLSASPSVWPMFPCRHSRRHQWSFSLQGQR